MYDRYLPKLDFRLPLLSNLNFIPVQRSDFFLQDCDIIIRLLHLDLAIVFFWELRMADEIEFINVLPLCLNTFCKTLL